LKGQKLKADVELVMIIAKTGDVESARAFKGDPRLFKRSEEAALKWHYKPYTINGYPFELETTLKFRFTRDEVKIVVPSSR